MLLRSVGEGAAIALDSIRANKLRSALTILGVVIGVTTVMAVASLVQGIRRQIFNAIEVAGPTTFYVIRFFSQTPINPDRLPYEVRIRPVLQRSDADAIRRVPEVRYAGIWVQVFQKIEYQGARTQQVIVFGADDRYMEIQGGTLLRGRFFSRAELTGEPVIVLESAVADRLFGRLDPLGKQVRVGGRSFRVIGVFEKPSNIFEPPGQDTGGVVPFATARESFEYDETNALFIAVKPRSGIDGRARDGRGDRGAPAGAEPPARATPTPSTSSPRTRSWTWWATSPPTSSWRWSRSPASRCWWAGSASWRS